MKVKQLLLVLCACLFVSASAIAEPRQPGQALSVRTFTFKYKEADKAAAIIRPLMSADGTISLQPGSKTLGVTDHAENMRAIAKALAEFDTEAQPFRLSIRIVSAARVENAGRVPDDLKDVAAKVALMRFNSFTREGEANVQGKEGDNGLIDMQTGYRADFKFGEYDPASDSIKINDLHVSRVQKEQLASLVTTSLNLRIGQTYILGAAKSPESKRALMIVLVARR